MMTCFRSCSGFILSPPLSESDDSWLGSTAAGAVAARSEEEDGCGNSTILSISSIQFASCDSLPLASAAVGTLDERALWALVEPLCSPARAALVRRLELLRRNAKAWRGIEETSILSLKW